MMRMKVKLAVAILAAAVLLTAAVSYTLTNSTDSRAPKEPLVKTKFEIPTDNGQDFSKF